MYGEVCGKSLRVLTGYTDRVEPFSIDEAYLDITDLVNDFSDAHILAQRIKHDLRAVLGPQITCSIGIAPNKMLAKLVSSFHKPDGITQVTPPEIPALLRQIALGDICGIGPRVERRLQRLGIYTVEQLGRIPRERAGARVRRARPPLLAVGAGHRPHPGDPLPPAGGGEVDGPRAHAAGGGGAAANSLTASCCACASASGGGCAGAASWAAACTSPSAMTSEWNGPSLGFGGRRRLPQASDNSFEIYQAAQSLVPPTGLARPVRRLQVCVADLSRHALQLSLLEDRVKQRNLQLAMDAVNDRFGEFTVIRGTTLRDTFPLRNGPPGHGLCKRYDVGQGEE